MLPKCTCKQCLSSAQKYARELHIPTVKYTAHEHKATSELYHSYICHMYVSTVCAIRLTRVYGIYAYSNKHLIFLN